MQKSNFSTLLIALFVPMLSSAQTKQPVVIQHATIFLNGAELTSQAKLNLPQGESEVLFTNIAGNVNQESLTIGADNQVIIQSAGFQNNYLQTEIISPTVKQLEDSLELFNEWMDVFQNKLTVISEQEAVLRENRKLSGQNTGLNVAEVQKMIDLISNKMTALLSDRKKIEKEKVKLALRIERTKRQLEEEKNKGFQPGGQLLVKFYAPKATTTNINMSYVVPNAGWTPTYDIRVDDLNKPVKIMYKANVFQNSGVKWNNISISLSTGNPTEGAEAPMLQPWHVAFFQPVQNYGYLNRKEAMPQVAMAGARTEGAAYKVDGVQVGDQAAQSSMNEYVAVDNSGINTTFDIELPYTINSDGKQQLVTVKSYELPASFTYYAAPKLDKDAFLQAKITNWEDLNLLPASTHIFYEGSYVGEGYIDMRNVKDTLVVSLGRDKKVIIKREMDKKFRSVKTIGNNVRESMAFSLNIRNTRKEKINLNIVDQFPISDDKDLIIEEKEAKESVIDENEMIKWQLNLEPNEQKNLKFSYLIKYPKGKKLSNY